MLDHSPVGSPRWIRRGTVFAAGCSTTLLTSDFPFIVRFNTHSTVADKFQQREYKKKVLLCGLVVLSLLAGSRMVRATKYVGVTFEGGAGTKLRSKADCRPG